MTRQEAYAALESAGVKVWRGEGKTRIYGIAGSWCFLAPTPEGSLAIELGSKSSWRHLDAVTDAVRAALPGVS